MPSEPEPSFNEVSHSSRGLCHWRRGPCRPQHSVRSAYWLVCADPGPISFACHSIVGLTSGTVSVRSIGAWRDWVERRKANSRRAPRWNPRATAYRTVQSVASSALPAGAALEGGSVCAVRRFACRHRSRTLALHEGNIHPAAADVVRAKRWYRARADGRRARAGVCGWHSRPPPRRDVQPALAQCVRAAAGSAQRLAATDVQLAATLVSTPTYAIRTAVLQVSCTRASGLTAAPLSWTVSPLHIRMAVCAPLPGSVASRQPLADVAYNAAACTLNASSGTLDAAYGCAVGYSGPLCGVCNADRDVARLSAACAPCPSPAVVATVVGGMAAAALGLLGVVATRTSNGDRSASSIALCYVLRNLVTAAQLLPAKGAICKLHLDAMWNEMWGSVVAECQRWIESLASDERRAGVMLLLRGEQRWGSALVLYDTGFVYRSADATTSVVRPVLGMANAAILHVTSAFQRMHRKHLSEFIEPSVKSYHLGCRRSPACDLARCRPES